MFRLFRLVRERVAVLVCAATRRFFVKMRWMLMMVLMSSLLTAVSRGADAPKTADEVFRFAGKKMAGYQTWSAEMKQGVNMMGMTMTLQGQTWFKHPRYSRTEMQMPMIGSFGKMTIIMGGDGIMWQQMDMLGQKKIMKIDMSVLASNISAKTGQTIDAIQNPDPARQWENSRKFMDFTLVKADKLDNQAVWVLDGTWNKEASRNPVLAQQVAAVQTMRLFIGQQDGFTHRIEQLDKESKPAISIEFVNVQFNPKLDDTMFQYKPPADTEVMDITDMSARMMQSGGGPTLP